MLKKVIVSLMLASSLFFAFARIASATSHIHLPSLVGPKKYYLALGDSLAFGYQPDLDFNDGYVDSVYRNLQGHHVKHLANMGCPGETSKTFIHGFCAGSSMRKFPYLSSQFDAALTYLALLRGQVSPVTLDIGADDVLYDIGWSSCTVDASKFAADLSTLDTNLTQIILPKLHQALIVDGWTTGDLVMMNYYDPYQNRCPNTVPYIQTLNQHLANDINGYGTLVDIFSAYGGASVPDQNACTYTWMCSIFRDAHPTAKGYSVIATAFEHDTGY